MVYNIKLQYMVSGSVAQDKRDPHVYVVFNALVFNCRSLQPPALICRPLRPMSQPPCLLAFQDTDAGLNYRSQNEPYDNLNHDIAATLS